MAGFNTQLVHGVDLEDNVTGAVNPPIYNSSTYSFPTVTSQPRWDYARTGNPTREFLERQIAQLEHGTHGFAFASGLAAVSAVLSTFSPGDRIVVGNNVYGGTYSLFNKHFSRWGLRCSYADTLDPDVFERIVSGQSQEQTPAVGDTHEKIEHRAHEPQQAVYFETLTNPLLQVNNVRTLAQIAHRHGALVIVDNTFVTPYLQQPLELGADIVIHSATKYLAGHSDVIAGLVVTANDTLAERLHYAQNRLGAVLSPNDSDAVRRGIQTLALRVERAQDNTLAVAEYLRDHPAIATVHYPGLEPDHERIAQDNALGGFGAVLSFEVAAGVNPEILLNNLRVFRLAVSLGAVESLAEYPSRMTHFELPRKERLKVGITDELIRLAIGIEDVEDLIADLDQAIAKARQH